MVVFFEHEIHRIPQVCTLHAAGADNACDETGNTREELFVKGRIARNVRIGSGSVAGIRRHAPCIRCARFHCTRCSKLVLFDM